MPPPAPAHAFLAIEPVVDPLDVSEISSARALVPVNPSSLPAVLEPAAPLATLSTNEGSDTFRDLDVDANVRKMSPRTMAELSMELYAAGVVNWDEYALLAFQPELQPDYDKTIGALTGEKAEPDRPRDFIAHWEKRLRFEERHNAKRVERIEQTRHIVNILYMLDVRARITSLA